MLATAVIVLVALLAAIVFAVVLLRKPENGVVLLAATIPLGAIPVLGDAGSFKLAGLAVFASWAINVVAGRLSIKRAINPITGLLGIFLLSSLRSAYSSGTHDGWVTFQRHILGFGLYLVIVTLVTSWEQVKRLLQWMLVSGTVVMGICVYLYLTGSPLVREHTVVVSGPRLAGLDSGINMVGKMAATMVIIALCGPFKKGRARLGQLAIPISAIAIVLTASRGAFLAFMAALLLYLIMNRQQRVYAILGAIVLVAVTALAPFAYFARIATIGERGEQGYRPALYLAALRAFADRPFLGHGLAQGPAAIFPYSGYVPHELESHNTILEIMVEQGLVGTVPFVLALMLAIRAGFRTVRKRDLMTAETRLSAEALIGICVVFGVEAMFIDLQSDPELYFLMGLLVAAIKFKTPLRSMYASGSLSASSYLRKWRVLNDRPEHAPQIASAGRVVRGPGRFGVRVEHQ